MQSGLHFLHATRLSPIVLAVLLIQITFQYEDTGSKNGVPGVGNLQPTVMVAILARNKAHTLPWFLGQLENLHYPKNRMSLWIRSDHNMDNTTEMLREWIAHISSQYHSVHFEAQDNKQDYEDSKGPLHWSPSRFENVMKLRQKALETARNIWADFILYIDADNIVENKKTLSLLTLYGRTKTIIAPMLNSSTHYSNFWGGMDESGYYRRTSDYIQIVNRFTEGVFPVALVHSTFLINLRNAESQKLAFYPPPQDYKGPFDDVIVFAHSAMYAGIQMHILNTHYFGSLKCPLDDTNTLDDERELFVHLKLEAIVEGPTLHQTPYIAVPDPPKSKLGFDQIYLINLERRPDRRERMLISLRELGIDVKIWQATDGKHLSDSYLKKLGIRQLEGFLEPYMKRPLTMGEIGCFLSHYLIWQDVVNNNYKKVLLFEDDVRFEPYFKTKLKYLLQEIENEDLQWELIYLGRKRLLHSNEPRVNHSNYLVYADYSYWTLSYMLSVKGAKKLLGQKPLSRMLPVDEYLPIMFDRHPQEKWKHQFEPRDLVGMSVEPLLVYPTHYTGEENYISDTEDSIIIAEGSKGDERSIKDEL